MGARKKDDVTPRRTMARQVCMTPATADMLDQVAEKHFNGRVSHALLALIDKPLKKAYAELTN